MNESSIFFIEPKGGNKYDFDKFPEDLYVDTCFWNEAFSSHIKSGTSYPFRNFIKEATVNHGTTLYTSGLVSNEIMHITKRSMIEQQVREYDIRKPRYRDGKVNEKELFRMVKLRCPNIESQIANETETILRFINEISESLNYCDDEKFEREVFDLLQKSQYCMGSIDAKHVVIAHMYGINSIATADGDYDCLDNVNLYVPKRDKYTIGRLSRRNIHLSFDENKY